MLSAIPRNWWLVALRGALAVVFGIVAFIWPGLTLEVLLLLFGAYAFVDGIIVLSFGLMAAGSGGRWWPLVLGGIVGIAAGVLTFFYPGATALALVLVIGGWAIVTGVLEIAGAIRLRNLISNEWLMGLSGLLSIVFGALSWCSQAAARSHWCTCLAFTPSSPGSHNWALRSACGGSEAASSRLRTSPLRRCTESFSATRIVISAAPLTAGSALRARSSMC